MPLRPGAMTTWKSCARSSVVVLADWARRATMLPPRYYSGMVV